jgi:DNA segregation ATPase FtsK/SpoIIIE, S-DNA-T family
VARRATPDEAPAPARGLGDVLGIVLIGAAVLLLVALYSYDPKDVSANVAPPNPSAHNWIGSVGAWISYAVFFMLGGAAYLVPPLLFLFGLSYLFQFMAYFHRRWIWAAILLLVCMACLDLYSDVGFLKRLHANINAQVGGWFGLMLNQYLFRHFGRVGATILFLMLYGISLLFLTNFQLGEWLRAFWHQRIAPAGGDAPENEQVLERRARDLEKQARKLKEQVERSGLGADLQPVPKPTVRDLSVPQESPARSPARSKAPPEPDVPIEVVGDVIPAREVTAATTADILGRPGGSASKRTEAKLTDTEADAPAPTLPAPAPTPLPPLEALPKPGVEETAAPPPAPTPKPKPAPKKPKPIAVAATPDIGDYKLPSLDFLQLPDLTVRPTESKEELMANARLMQQTLAQFDIEVSLGDITKGPTITRYELHPAPGVKLERITALSNNIAAALKAERIHILAPVPGKSSVGVEVPNLIKTKVIMRDLLESEEWRSSKARIPLALGKDVYGHPIVTDLSEMPHLLIAGSTGSGKSVCINAIIASLLFRFSPDQLRFVMIDPKVVELQQYNVLPHLVVPVVTDPKKVVLALRWVVSEMEKRYQIFARVGVRNIKSFNERPKNKPLPVIEPELPLKARKEKIEPGADGFAVEVDEQIVVPRDDDIVIPERLSYIVVIIDELADLMLVAPADVEMAIARITQMARAAGIHVIVATQRPSVDVITGVIKANIPARIAFQVAAKVDSRTILDAMGADKLLGKGDMLYLPPGSAKLIRAQGALITDQEINSIVEFISKQGKPSYELEIHQQLSKPAGGFDGDEGIDEDEELIEQCIEVIRSEQKASVSLLQRRLRLGYTRAARIMDELENRGIVGPSKGAEPRDILIDLDGGGADGGGQQAV